MVEKALSSNPGMDACLGLYDEYYDTYDIPDKLSALKAADESKSADAQAETSEKPEAPSGSSRTYRVKSGDCLWNIAASELGDGNRWKEIYDLNKKEIDNPRLIYAGQEFVLPAA